MGRYFGGSADISLGTVNHNIGGGEFSWFAWVIPGTISGWQTIMVNDTGNADPGLYSTMGGGNWGIWWGGQRNSGNTLTAGNLYFLVVTRDSSDEILFYQNGIDTNNGVTVSNSMSNASTVYGNNPASAARLTGEVLNIGSYKHCLSPGEVSYLYHRGNPLSLRRKNLIFNHDFSSPDERFLNLVSSQYNGTDNGTTYRSRKAPIRKFPLNRAFRPEVQFDDGGAAPAGSPRTFATVIG